MICQRKSTDMVKEYEYYTNVDVASILKALAHYNWNFTNSRYRPYTLQPFSQLQRFFNSFISRFYIWATILLEKSM